MWEILVGEILTNLANDDILIIYKCIETTEDLPSDFPKYSSPITSINQNFNHPNFFHKKYFRA